MQLKPTKTRLILGMLMTTVGTALFILIARACSESAERSKTVVTPNHISVLDGDDLNPSWRSTRPRNVNLNEQASPRTGSS
jgi:hypothetical protein